MFDRLREVADIKKCKSSDIVYVLGMHAKPLELLEIGLTPRFLDSRNIPCLTLRALPVESGNSTGLIPALKSQSTASKSVLRRQVSLISRQKYL